MKSACSPIIGTTVVGIRLLREDTRAEVRGSHSNYFAQSPCHLSNKNHSKMGLIERNSTVRETVINCVEAPRLRVIFTTHFIAFKRLPELYKKGIEENSRHLKEDIIRTSYRASIKEDNLKTSTAPGSIEADYIDELSKRLIQQCVEKKGANARITMNSCT